MKRALIIRHAAPETLASNFHSILVQQGFQLEPLNVFETAPTYSQFSSPGLGEISFILVLGGPFSANDDLPALKEEQAYLKEAMVQGKPVFGICLGAQLMATALGGRVEPSGGYQFGLRKISVTASGDADPVFSQIAVPLVPTLHGDCFTIPHGATKLAEAFMLCRDGSYQRINMAFRHGKSYAFQFEPQLTLEELRVWDQDLKDDYKLMGDHFDSSEEAARNLAEFARFAPTHEKQMRELLIAFLRNAGLAEAS